MTRKSILIIFTSGLLLVCAGVCWWALGFGPSSKNQQASAKTESDESESWEDRLPSLAGIGEKLGEVKDDLQDMLVGKNEDEKANSGDYPLHENISTTFFWVGEGADDDNHDISNSPSCWDDSWKKSFGGVDNPKKRNGFFPSAFTPKENPFYFALPFNDFNSKGNRKQNLADYVPWFGEKDWKKDESICKNRWIKIMKDEKIAYAQWEDAGPFGENDIAYVFGTGDPKSKSNKNAGLDVSPAVRDYLGLKDIDKTSWQFVDEKDVPNGPWKEVITTSGVNWN
ncbi:MAG: hypothetical protein PHF35_01915 [Candidatus Moranbacteria bacterium]|nr:hypothetical protein [Candidatus Moranbacteria bacterium]